MRLKEAQISGERLQDHWSSGIQNLAENAPVVTDKTSLSFIWK